jgi:hypothetical protein
MSTQLTAPQPPSAEVQLVALRPNVETALRQACEALAQQNSIDRFEIAVQSRIQEGIRNDNDLRLTDELLVNVVRAGDQIVALCKPATAAAFTLHRALTAIQNEWIGQDGAKRWTGRWGALREKLSSVMLKYKRDKADLERRQNEELERAAAERRRQEEAKARAALRDGDVAGAQAAMQTAQSIVAPVVMPSAPVLDHSTDRKEWVITITDPEAFIKSIAAGIVPLSAVKEFDLFFLKKEAAKRGGLPANWAGVSARQQDKISVSRR